jgi:hypothetical protein
LRTSPWIATALALGGCGGDWEFFGVPTECVKVMSFADLDGDGWGDPASEGTPTCPPLTDGSVSNNRDCNDDDGAVTGRVGSLCPEQLVAPETDFTPVTVGSEFVIVHPDTDVVWSSAAEQSCGPFGWGGKFDMPEGQTDLPRPGLATFRDSAQLDTVLAALGARTVYGGFVGFHPTLHQWGQYDDAGTWVPDTDVTSFTVPLCNCIGETSETCDDRYTEDLGYLALIRDGTPDDALDPDDWCLGTPEEALPEDATDDPPYEMLYGHFICERAIPNPDDWALAVPDESEQDSAAQ